MNKETVLHHHLGLGDHFVCNGLVHEVAVKYDRIHLPTKRRNYKTIDCLYSDWDNIVIFDVGDDVSFEFSNIQEYCLEKKLPIIKVGFEYLNTCRKNANICFYEQLGVEPSLRHTGFRLPTNIPNTKLLYSKLIYDKKYCLVHRQSSIGEFQLRMKTNLPIVEVRSGLTENLLEYVDIIKYAEEIHCIDSSLINLVDCMMIKTEKLFFHTIKPQTEGFQYSDKWNIIQYS